MSITYKDSGADIQFLYDCPINQIPFRDEVNRIYVGYRQCYSKDPTAPIVLSAEGEDNILEIYKNFCKDSIFVDDQYGGKPTIFDPVDQSIEYTAANVDAYVKSQCERYGRKEFCVFLTECMFIKSHLRHESPFEHAGLTVRIINASRSFSHQWVRSRIASHSQQSQRYVSEKNGNFTLVLPDKIYDNPEAKKIVTDYLDQLPEVINKLADAGIKNEDIRCIFPNAMSTSIVSTMNFREWKHLFDLRIDSHAQKEIRDISYAIWEYLNERIPFVWADCWDRIIKTYEGITG